MSRNGGADRRRGGGPRDNDEIRGWIEGALAHVPSVARRFLGCGLAFDELLAAGNLGLVQAALRFDPSRNVKFVTYAGWWIRKTILKTIQVQVGPVRLPRYRLEQLRDVHDARRRLARSGGVEPDLAALSRATGLSSGDVELLLGIGLRALSLEQPIAPGESLSVGGLLEADPERGPQRALVRRDSLRHLRQLLDDLGERERRVLDLRFGLGGHPPRTLREAGRILGISRERVRQIENRALRQLRDLLR